MKIKYPNRAYVVINYSKITYFVIVWSIAILILPFLILAAISDPIVNWFCKFATRLSNQLNL